MTFDMFNQNDNTTTGCGSTGAVNSSLSGPQPGVIYYIDDHLGSSHLVTDSLGNVFREESRYPYGLERSSQPESQSESAVAVDYVYTGKEYDSETGLIYFGGRYYAPELGRWITPDPLFLEKEPKKVVEMPLSSNLYAYVRNNPMTYVDETGYLESGEFELYQRELGGQYAENIQSGPWSEDDALFQTVVGSGLAVMASLAMGEVAVGAIAATPAAAAVGSGIQKGTEIAQKVLYDPRTIAGLKIAADLISGYSTPYAPQNYIQAAGAVTNIVIGAAGVFQERAQGVMEHDDFQDPQMYHNADTAVGD